MNSESLKIGDVVKLKSDSPWMTIIKTESPNNSRRFATCTFFSNSTQLFVNVIVPVECLILKEN